MAQATKLVIFTQWPESETAGPTSQSAGFERQIIINFAVIIDGNHTHKAPVSRDIAPTTNPGWQQVSWYLTSNKTFICSVSSSGTLQQYTPIYITLTKANHPPPPLLAGTEHDLLRQAPPTNFARNFTVVAVSARPLPIDAFRRLASSP